MLSILLGMLLGVGLFTFGYARGSSYLSNDPGSCVNCHVMREQYEGWMKSSHGSVAVCNDCHTPPGLVPKYGTKALNGFFHSWAFTTQWFPDRIQITHRNRSVTESACLKCHEQMVDGIAGFRPHAGPIACIDCHRNVGHAH